MKWSDFYNCFINTGIIIVTILPWDIKYNNFSILSQIKKYHVNFNLMQVKQLAQLGN